VSQRLAASRSLGARFIQREIILSERSKPSIRSSPWMQGAPHVGFSATIPKVKSRTPFDFGILPTRALALEIGRPYKRNPAGSQRTAVSGVTMMRECFQLDQTRRATTQKILSKMPRLGRRCRRFRTVSCWRNARFSKTRPPRLRKGRSRALIQRRSGLNMAGSHIRSTIGSIVVNRWFCGLSEFWRGTPLQIRNSRKLAPHTVVRCLLLAQQ
jgi:hypothetical protein